MQTGLINSWAGNPQDIGAMYPFVGWESVMFVIGFIFWLAWMILLFRKEGADFQEDIQVLKKMELQEKVRSNSIAEPSSRNRPILGPR